MAMFITEMLNKTVKEESHAQELTEFLIRSLISLDQMDGKTSNFHLVFLLKLSRFLGFGAHHVHDVFGTRTTSRENEQVLSHLLSSEYFDHIAMQNSQRREILDLIIKFFADHIENLGEIKSIQVLREIL
jgi:DNA repair protein RecO (recombination protein O)